MYLDPEAKKPTCRFQAEETTTDNGSAAYLGRIARDLRTVIDGAKDEDAGPMLALFGVQLLDTGDEGARASRDNQLIVGDRLLPGSTKLRHRAVMVFRTAGDHLLVGAIDIRNAHTSMQRNVVLRIPRQRIEEDIVCALRT